MSLATSIRGSLRAALFVGAVCGGDAWGQDQPEPPTAFVRHPVALGARFMAVTANRHATEAAVAMMRDGGSAVDAAIAAQLVLNLVEPQSSGIGGGGFLLHWDAATRKLAAYDGRETAPGTATPERFAGLAFRDAVASGRSIGTPGLVAMLALAHRRHGQLAWARLFDPAIQLAETGFPVSPRLHALLRDDPLLRGDIDAARLYYTAEGAPRAVGSMLRNPAFAETLRTIARFGPEIFYRGPLAVEIVAKVRAAGGDLDIADLARYEARERVAVCGPYRVWRVCGMPPPSSGGVTVLQLLGILERTPFANEVPVSPRAIHWFAEAGRLAYADRNRYLGDPDFIDVPQAQLLAPEYLSIRARLAGAEKLPAVAAAGELPSTSHLSIVDAHGNAVALTSSIEDAFGSRKLVAGFLLNNQLTDFAFAAAADGKLVANRVEAGKRPLSSMAPTMVFGQDGELIAVLGSPGGSRIINYVAKTVVALFDWKMAPDEAVALPHFGSRNGPTELERGVHVGGVADSLMTLGHRVVGRSRYAEKSRTGPARITLHEHSDGDVGVILQPIVRKRQHDKAIQRRL